jgi:hypothetical protein
MPIQIRLRPEAFKPLSAGWILSLSDFLYTSLPAQCQPKRCHVKLKSKTISSHVEQYIRYDTAQADFYRNGYQIIKRNDYEHNRTDLVVKYNHVDLGMVLSAPIHPRDSLLSSVKLKQKEEQDIYPCSNKFARSIKLVNALRWNETISDTRMLAQWLKHVRRATHLTKHQPLIETTTFARHITEVEAQVGYVNRHSEPVAVATVFTLSATYPSVKQAIKAVDLPSKVELSLRYEPLPKKVNSRLLLESFWNVFDILGTFNNTVDNEC